MKLRVRTTRILWAALLLNVAPACGASAPREAPPTALTGRVLLPRGNSVPAGAVLELRILDITPVEKVELSVLALRGPLAPPVPFALAFDWLDVDPSHSYALRARVYEPARDGRGERDLFATAADSPVLTRGHPRKLDLALVALDRSATAP